MGWGRWGRLMLVCTSFACMHDFDAFEKASETRAPTDGGTSTAEAEAGPGAPSDASPGEEADASSKADAGGPTVDASSCTGPGATRDGGHCYFPLQRTLAREAAAAACVAAGAHLATIGSDAEQATVAGISSNRDRWFGLRRPAGSPSGDASFVWDTGEPRVFARWGSGEPNGTGECARIRSTGEWADSSCTQTYDAVCERD